MVVAPGIPLARIYALDMAQISLPIAETDIKFLAILLDGSVIPTPKQPSVILMSNFAGINQEWKGKILRSAAEIDSRTRMLSVIGQIPTSQPAGSGFPIKVGMFVNASIQGRVFNDIYVVPREKVRDNVVWVLNKEGLLSKREVTVFAL